MAKKCSMCGASLKMDAKECEYCGTNVYEEEKDKYIRENYQNSQYTSSYDTMSDEEKIKQLEEKITTTVSNFKKKKSFNLVLFMILFMFATPFAIIYLIVTASDSTNNTKK